MKLRHGLALRVNDVDQFIRRLDRGNGGSFELSCQAADNRHEAELPGDRVPLANHSRLTHFHGEYCVDLAS